MTIGLHVWDDMLDLFFEEEDRVKLEWAIGAALTSGTKNMVIILGGPMSGKSTTLHLIKQIVMDNPAVTNVSVHDDVTKDLPSNTSHSFSTGYTFIASDRLPALTTNVDRIVVHTTGKTIPVEHYGTLVKTAAEAHAEIAEQCKHMYRELGADYYDNKEEDAK